MLYSLFIYLILKCLLFQIPPTFLETTFWAAARFPAQVTKSSQAQKLDASKNFILT